jgi:hypothetical protein
VQLLTSETAESLFKTDALELANLANGGVLHRLHNIHGELMICSDSVYECFQNRGTQMLVGKAVQVSI